MKQYIETGKITSTHALKGEVKITPWCDDINFLTTVGEFYLDENGLSKLNIENIRVCKNILIAKFQSVNNVDEADKLIGNLIYIYRNLIKLKDGEFLFQDLIGLTVIDVNSQEIYGEIFKITKTGANDVYYIKNNDGKELLIPAIKEVIKDVDIQKGLIKIKPLEGLFDI